jgi:hypothetical protein
VIAYPACHWIVEGGSGPDSVEVAGNAVALNWSAYGIPNYEESFVSWSDNDFQTSSKQSLGEHRNDHVGFISAAGGVKLADALSRGSFVKLRLQQ